ncbi:cupin domain-containing protein [Spirosoma telluris]|uniref:cupin domain-containing protein n=1 Tax=Spirosoma telluris TaxID=2183553 RepID=UPI002FC3480D
MQRRKFLVSTLAVSTFATQATPHNRLAPQKPFTVKAGDARFGVHTPYRGVNANDVKISGKDTNGQLAVFEYVGTEKVGPVLHVHHDQDEIFSIVDGEYLFQVGDEKFIVKAGDTVFAPVVYRTPGFNYRNEANRCIWCSLRDSWKISS